MKANFLSFAFIYIFGSGLFNALRQIQIKNILPVFRLSSGRPKTLDLTARQGRGFDPMKRNT
jgi:hypothetical protein